MTKQEAETQIAAILQQLEIDSGSVVEAISLRSMEITCVADAEQRFQMSVEVGLRRLPGHQWAT